METQEKRTYCSSCKHSKYVLDGNGQKRLYCELRRSWGQKPFLPTTCTQAEDCLEYVRERWRDSLTCRSSYKATMSKCGIPLDEEYDGLLADVELE